MTHPSFPYSESSVFSIALQPSSRSAFEKRRQIFDSIVDHEGRLARSEVGAFRWAD
jgi:hypothetical protein